MPDSDTLYTSNSNVTIPGYAINVSVEIAGAQGAGGGSDAGASAGSGGAGRKGIVYFPDYSARTLTLSIGGQGGSGNGCVADGGAGGGGSNGGGGGGKSGPRGCSGGGGGGGGYTAIYDNFHNAYVAVAAGGGGGGGASWNASATNGGNGGSFSAYSSTITPATGGGGSSCPNDGGGGGGGGGGASAGGGGYEGYDNNRGGGGGGGGGSGYRSSYVSVGGSSGTTNYGNGYARVRYDIGSPEITTFTVSPTAIIRGQNATLTWSITNASSAEISNQVGAVSVPTGTATITPDFTTTYTLTAYGPGGTTDTASVPITVYIPPVLNLTLDSSSIIVNGSTTLRWTTTGDADTIYWVEGGITNTNLDSSEPVSPSVTTTYSAYVSGLGGLSPLATVILYVYYPPTLNVDYPASIIYGEQALIEYSGDYADTSVTISATYNYDYIGTTTDPVANLNTATSAEFGPDSGYSGEYNTNIVYNDRGPLSVTYVITATGQGGTISQPFTIPIIVDDTPDNVTIPESGDLLKDQEPVTTPDTEVLSEMILIDGVDIQVEIKASDPVNVDVNANDSWTKIRQIGTPPAVQGNSFPTESGVYHIKPSSNLDEPPTYELQTQVTFAELASLVTCVSVIDETSGSAYSNNQGLLNNCWSQNPPVIGGGDVDSRRGFRTAFPYRSFYLLDPGGPNNINLPANWSTDAYAYGPIGVNRDNGSSSARSDWFTICNFQSLPYGTIVSIWIDVSGSMTLSTVQASYDYFLTRCANAGIEIVLSLSASGERYIEGHIQYLPPSANFTATDSDGNTSNIQIVAGDPVTLSWVVFGDATNVEVTPDVLSPTSDINQFVKTVTVNPEDDTTYTLSAQGPAGITSRTITIEVLVPPTITLTSSAGDTLLVGECTTISWTVQGDGSSIAWTTGDIDNTNLSSSAVVCPVDTFTYCAVASGPGGVSPETCITIYVKQPPSASITVPAQVDYGQDFNIEYETKFADDSISIVPTYQYLDGTSVTGTSINPSAAASAELSDPDTDTVRDGTVPIIVPWNDFGPFRIDFVITANGTGGTATDFDNTSVNIDQTPVNLNIEESGDNLKDAEPVYTPDTEILSEMYLIDDIDIPVEIKASDPIKVDINKNDNWEDVRQI